MSGITKMAIEIYIGNQCGFLNFCKNKTQNESVHTNSTLYEDLQLNCEAQCHRPELLAQHQVQLQILEPLKNDIKVWECNWTSAKVNKFTRWWNNATTSTSKKTSNNKNDNGIDTDKFRTKFTPVKKFPKNKFSNTAPNKRPSSRSSLKRMLNKNSRTLSNIHKKGHRYKYLARPKSSPIASLATRQAGKKGTNIRSSNSSLILMQNNLFGGSYTSSNSSYGNSYVDSKHRVVRGSENIEIRPPLVKKLKKTTKKSTKKYMAWYLFIILFLFIS